VDPLEVGAAAPATAPSGAPSRDARRDPVTLAALRARDGDASAEAAFVRRTQADVWRLCAALVDRSAAEDLAQECYLRAFRALPAFEGRSSGRTWLLAIARRTCADHLRAATRRRRLVDLLASRAAEASVPDPAGGVSAADLLARLEGTRRSAFVLTQVIGLSYEEAAEVEGVPVGTIRSRVWRARSDLVAAVGDGDEGGAAR
jgi:RNA polymerase sigma-70 factor (ECF subfamily)